ncbi:hypothetical protein [Martelella sp. AD-3]|uniref:hypothetical protein n=1 Tax=Martelella sp. AD-3 TaxID=686597 RepID=UPI00046654AD|nr:hypothetical protein [Martelella sp. AD-3]AMM84566.1 hypothetical protein AZF01_09535 [Martelella sp. AD-3]MAM11491.1 hypothetical protein [Rhizobiaceae bacterium]
MTDQPKDDPKGGPKDGKADPLDSPVGGEGDVESVAEEITTRQISAQTFGGDPVEDRRQRLKDIITELESRTKASERGEDLEPLLQEARSSLAIVERQAERGEE